MVINILFGLIVLLFLIIGGLFALVWKPEWLERIRLKLNQNNKENIKNDSSEMLKNISEPKIEDFTSKLKLIKDRLDCIKKNFEGINPSYEINELYSKIDNIKSYLGYVSNSEEYLLDVIINQLQKIDIDVPEENKLEKQNTIVSELSSIFSLLKSYDASNTTYNESLRKFHKDAVSELSNELAKYKKLKDILENASTIKVYLVAEKRYSKSFYTYIFLFTSFILIALYSSYWLMKEKNHYLTKFQLKEVDFWTFKITSIFIFITLITFLLKQAIHYQKKRDDAESTRLELEAFPAYVSELEASDRLILRKDLAPKYFGKVSDNSTLNELSGLVTEQIKTSSELAKSSADIIKVLKDKI